MCALGPLSEIRRKRGLVNLSEMLKKFMEIGDKHNEVADAFTTFAGFDPDAGTPSIDAIVGKDQSNHLKGMCSMQKSSAQLIEALGGGVESAVTTLSKEVIELKRLREVDNEILRRVCCALVEATRRLVALDAKVVSLSGAKDRAEKRETAAEPSEN